MSVTISPLHNSTTPAGSLTTIWTPPCPGGPMTTWDSNANRSLEGCMPTNYKDLYYDGNVGYYSPGICPSGYTSACSRYNTQQGPPLEPEETAVMCAPSGYTCNPNQGVSNAWHSQTADNSAPMIQVRWQASDISTLETHPLTPGLRPASQTKTSQGTTTSTATAGGGQAPDTGSDSVRAMQGSTIAGIVIGSVLGVLVLGMAILVFLRHGCRACFCPGEKPTSGPEASLRPAASAHEIGSQAPQSYDGGSDAEDGTPHTIYYSPSHVGHKPPTVGTEAQAVASPERHDDMVTVYDAQPIQLFSSPAEMPTESLQHQRPPDPAARASATPPVDVPPGMMGGREGQRTSILRWGAQWRQ
ncbi:hypothetical protein MGG_04770 [Pyricularia oryzae 70-15]|uniref:Uncharacterized protein n=3 Tax=Pyricularia oryzae TaxID=318829 RepID=G4MTS6_PYRO7|nr:uncharacterized protein MGG_04770 [Pyricularia oryzae 70-15]EHA53915.1 hypothetical protein MGG_04770 [Pyricularia oryzae 70-15]ELQ42738.1 hypothetical protein OOU_Y34scaffold00194g51 [Pyricularia oryzae Y34]KAI7929842.1 hypothetical protein M0657_001989 [Pyricularia oryzae]